MLNDGLNQFSVQNSAFSLFRSASHTSLFTTAALSVSTVAADGAHFDVLSRPRLPRSPLASFGPGRNRFATIIARAIAPGARRLTMIAAFAGTEIVNSGSPKRQAS